MPFRVRCPKCDADLALPDSMRGKAAKVSCKKCSAAFTVGKTAGAEVGIKSGAKSAARTEGIRPASRPSAPRPEDDDFDSFDDAPRPRRDRRAAKEEKS